MTPEAAKVEELIRETVGSFVEYPHALEFTCVESANGNANFKMRCHPDDESKVVGVGGSHIKAMTFLVRTLGLSKGKHFRFEFIAQQHAPTLCV